MRVPENTSEPDHLYNSTFRDNDGHKVEPTSDNEGATERPLLSSNKVIHDQQQPIIESPAKEVGEMTQPIRGSIVINRNNTPSTAGHN